MDLQALWPLLVMVQTDSLIKALPLLTCNSSYFLAIMLFSNNWISSFNWALNSNSFHESHYSDF